MKKFLDLGLQPLANSLLTKKNLKKKEKKFRLQLGFNSKNYLVSIINTVPKEKMFNEKYPYCTFIINYFYKQIEWRKYFERRFHE